MNKIEHLAKNYIYWPEITNPFQQNISFGENSFFDFSESLKSALMQPKVDVSTQILEFYALNQYLYEQREKQGNVLDDKLIGFYKDYQNTINKLSEKMFCYIFLTSMIEASQAHDFSEQNSGFNSFLEISSKENTDFKKIRKTYHNKIVQTYKNDCPKGFFETFKLIHQIFNQYNQNIFPAEKIDAETIYSSKNINSLLNDFSKSKLTVNDLITGFSIIFKKNNFFEGNFGGKPWDNIVQHALKFSQGKINAEVFVDQAFSLEHNGGTIFNKDIIFDLAPHFSIKMGNSFMNNIQIKMSNFLLNMQHEGEILNFLRFESSFEKISQNVQKLQLNPEEKKSIDTFNSQMKKQSEFFIQSPILQKITQSDKKSNIKVNWLSFLSYKNNDNQRQYFLNDYQKNILNIANSVQNNNLQKKQTNIKKKTTRNLSYFHLGQVPVEINSKESIGSKAYGLNSMILMGQNVPQGVVFPCSGVQEGNLGGKLTKITKQIQKDLEPNKEPNLYSVRSGAAVSMPGMMDTILNVGLDDSNYYFYVNKMGKLVADECAIKFMKQFSKSSFDNHTKWPNKVHNCLKKFKAILKENHIKFDENKKFPLESYEQLAMSFQAVIKSYKSPRSINFRLHHQIDDNIGTAIIVQKMVFGNLNTKSCTGVMFSRDCIAGNSKPIGEFLTQGQGEDVVSGDVTPLSLDKMKQWNKSCYQQLVLISKQLEKSYRAIQDIEFTIENGEIFILQTRNAALSALAQNVFLKEKYKNKEITFDEFLAASSENTFVNQQSVQTKNSPNYQGLCANPGVIQGEIINISHDTRDWQKYISENKNKNFILVSEKTSPEHSPLMMQCQAFITQDGGFTSHAAILARSWNKPCVVGVIGALSLKTGEVVTIDAQTASIWRGSQEIIQTKNSNFIKQIIDENDIDIEKIAKNKLINEINNISYWMKFGNKTHINTNIHNPHRFNSFLKMGQNVLVKMSYAAKKQVKRNKIS